MIEIKEVYDVLRKRNLVSDQYDFSENWLGRGKSYYSVIQCMGRTPSLYAWMMLKIRVESHLEMMRDHIRNGLVSKLVTYNSQELETILSGITLRLKHIMDSQKLKTNDRTDDR